MFSFLLAAVLAALAAGPLRFAHDLPGVELLPAQRQAVSLGELLRGRGEVSRGQDLDRRTQDRPR